MTTTKIAALIRSEASPSELSSPTVAALVASHLNVFGLATTLASQEELVAARDSGPERVIKLELDVERPPSGDLGARLKAVGQSLRLVAKRAGVSARFELFVVKASARPEDRPSG